ncbi:hypothetical protein ACFVQB_17365 [Paenibacillus sp. NPDC057886]|uniref:hypothetical protein n=1 Tax=Paenibacillus sp. NPDC057886 TaxID=3346270 RepID=UPI003693BA4B
MKKVVLLFAAIFMFLLSIAPSASAAGDRLIYDIMYNNSIPLVSSNNRFSLQYNVYGDLQLWDNRTRTMLWNTKTSDTRINHFKIDYWSGKLVLQDPQNTPYWTSDNKAWSTAWYGADNVPPNLRGNVLIVQNDGNLVLYNTETPSTGWYPVWASNTGGH